MYSGNIKKVMADAVQIVGQLRSTNTTVTQLKKKYHCRSATLIRAIYSKISPAEYKTILRKKRLIQHRGHNRIGFKKEAISPVRMLKPIFDATKSRIVKEMEILKATGENPATVGAKTADRILEKELSETTRIEKWLLRTM